MGDPTGYERMTESHLKTRPLLLTSRKIIHALDRKSMKNIAADQLTSATRLTSHYIATMSVPMPTPLRFIVPSARKIAVSTPRLHLFVGYGLRHKSYTPGKRELQTSTAFRPHTLPDGMFPFHGDLSNVAAQEIASSAPDPSSSLSSLFANASASGEKEKKKWMDAQKRDVSPNSTSASKQSQFQSQSPQPSAAATPSSTQSQRPRRKLRARKAAISLTPAAVSHIRGLLEGPNPRLIRIGVKNRGCSGLSYLLDYVEKPGAFDEIIEQDGVKVLIDSKALFSIIGSEMDWEDKKLSSKFVFRNPNIST